MLVDSGKEPDSRDNEDYAGLFTEAAPHVARATNDDKRRRLRDLLFNSLFIPQGDPCWEESIYCLELLKEIDVIGLYAIARVTSAQREQLFIGLLGGPEAEWAYASNNPGAGPVSSEWIQRREKVKYSALLLEKQVAKLTRNPALLQENRVLITYGNYSTGMSFYSLTPEGEMLVKWTIADF